MTIINGTQKHNREGSSKSSRSFGRGEEEQNKRVKDEDFVPYPWDPSKYHLDFKEIYTKACTHHISFPPIKILLTWLSWKEMSKQSYLNLSFKSHKSCAKALSLWELGPRTLWLTHFYEVHSYIYICVCVCVCVCACVCFRIYILIWETNNYLRIFVFYSCSYAKLIEIKGKDKIHCIVSMEKDPMA